MSAVAATNGTTTATPAAASPLSTFTISAENVGYITIQQVFGLYNAAWMGVLVTVAVALVLLSTPAQRRGPIFTIQCLAFCMALTNTALVTMAVVLNFRQNWTTDNMLNTLISIECAQKAFEMFTPLVCDITLIFKVMAFYPPTVHHASAQWYRRAKPVIPLMVLGVCRAMTCLIVTVFYYYYDKTANGPEPLVSVRYGKVYHRTAMVEFALQIAYCSYASALLFRKIYLFAQHRQLRKRQTANLQRRLRYLIESLAMTFILPVIAQLVALGAAATQHGYVLFIASLTNIYLSTLLSVLATSWSTIRIARVHHQSRHSTLQLSEQRLISGNSADKREHAGAAAAMAAAALGWPASKRSSSGSGPRDAASDGSSPLKDDEEAIQQQQVQQQVHIDVPYKRPGGVGEVDEAGAGYDSHRETLLANLFDDDVEENMHGQATSMEMLSSMPQISSSIEPAPRLPTRGTSGWRRGVLRA